LNETLTPSEAQEIDEYVEHCYKDRVFAIESMITIVDKAGKEVPFKLWPGQRRFIENKSHLNIVVKPRRIGQTMVILADASVESRLYKNRDNLVLTKDGDDEEMVFNFISGMAGRMNPLWKGDLKKSQAKMLHYEDNGSIQRVQTAGASPDVSKKKGRSQNITYFHGTEWAYIKYAHLIQQGAFNSVPTHGTICIESTADGPKGVFYASVTEVKRKGTEIARNTWRNGDQTLFFFSFLEHPEYKREVPADFRLADDEEIRLTQLCEQWGIDDAKASIMWRRAKIAEMLNDPESTSSLSPEMQFKREFPATLEDAFESSGGNYFQVPIMDSLETLAKIKSADPLVCGLIPKAGERPTVIPSAASNKFTIWELPKDGWKNRYLFFGDVGQGLETSDFDYGYILDRVTKRYVAEFHGRLGAQIHCALALALCEFYFSAWFCWDITGIGAELRPLVIASEYKNVYLRRPVLEEGHLGKTEREDAMGFLFTKATRLMALSSLKVAIEKSTHYMPDPVFYQHAKQFGFDDKGNGPEAAPGYNDDAVMSAAGACYCDINLPQPTEEIRLVRGDNVNKFRERIAKAQSRHNSREEGETGNY
jgi:hypothetical protein